MTRSARRLHHPQAATQGPLRGDPSIERIERSPGDSSLAIVTSLSHAEHDFWWQTFDVTVVPVP
jgi:hypothetical protein